MIKPFLPTLVEIGPLQLHLYGLFIGIAIILVLSKIPDNLLKRFKSYDIGLVLLSTLVGARGLFLLHNIDEIVSGEIGLLNFNNGGLAIYGAMIGLGISSYVVCRARDIKFLEFTDAIAITLPFAQAVGRLGNFANQELYGYPTDLPWKLFVQIQSRLPGYESYEYYHPTFLYEIVLNILSGITLNLVARSRGWYLRGSPDRGSLTQGCLTFCYLINYGLIRLFVNRFRIDKEYWGFVETSDLFSFLIITIGATGIIYVRGKTP